MITSQEARKLTSQELQTFKKLNEARKKIGLKLLSIKTRRCNNCPIVFETYELRNCGCNQKNNKNFNKLNGSEIVHEGGYYNYFADLVTAQHKTRDVSLKDLDK